MALGTMAWGLMMSARNQGTGANLSRPTPSIGSFAARPDEQGLQTLALLKLTPVCFAPGPRLRAAAEAGTPLAGALTANDLLTCCTHCHADGKSAAAVQVASSARFTQSCAACHRG